MTGSDGREGQGGAGHGPLERVLRFIGRHVRGFYAAVLTYLSFAFFVAVGAVLLFVQIAEEVLEGETQEFDEAILEWVAARRTPLLDAVGGQVTALGNTATLAVLVLSISALLWVSRHHYSTALLMVAVAGGGLVNTLLKAIFGRPRPEIVDWVTDVNSLSFPSGHAMGSAIAYGCVAYLVGRLGPTRAMRWTTWIVATVVILAIGASRVYLGVHYPSDVLGGFIAGLAWIAFVISGMTAIRYFAGRHPEVEKAEEGLHREAAVEGEAKRERPERPSRGHHRLRPPGAP